MVKKINTFCSVISINDMNWHLCGWRNNLAKWAENIRLSCDRRKIARYDAMFDVLHKQHGDGGGGVWTDFFGSEQNSGIYDEEWRDTLQPWFISTVWCVFYLLNSKSVSRCMSSCCIATICICFPSCLLLLYKKVNVKMHWWQDNCTFLRSIVYPNWYWIFEADDIDV